MIKVLTIVLFLLASLTSVTRAQLAETQAAFAQAASERGMKAAFLEFLGDDATVFLPGAINGKQYWKERPDDPSTVLVRDLTYTDISANGLLGYTTGNWRT